MRLENTLVHLSPLVNSYKGRDFFLPLFLLCKSKGIHRILFIIPFTQVFNSQNLQVASPLLGHPEWMLLSRAKTQRTLSFSYEGLRPLASQIGRRPRSRHAGRESHRTGIAEPLRTSSAHLSEAINESLAFSTHRHWNLRVLCGLCARQVTSRMAYTRVYDA